MGKQETNRAEKYRPVKGLGLYHKGNRKPLKHFKSSEWYGQILVF